MCVLIRCLRISIFVQPLVRPQKSQQIKVNIKLKIRTNGEHTVKYKKSYRLRVVPNSLKGFSKCPLKWRKAPAVYSKLCALWNNVNWSTSHLWVRSGHLSMLVFTHAQPKRFGETSSLFVCATATRCLVITASSHLLAMASKDSEGW